MDSFRKNAAETEEIQGSPILLVSRRQLEDIISPLIKDVQQTIIDVMPILPTPLDTEKLVGDVSTAVKESVTVINKTVTQEMALPPEILELLKLQSHAIGLLKSAATAPAPAQKQSLEEYKAHDQAKMSGTKVSFYGFAAPDGAWYIMRQDGRASKQRYASGAAGYTQAWQEREDLKYTTLSEAYGNK